MPTGSILLRGHTARLACPRSVSVPCRAVLPEDRTVRRPFIRGDTQVVSPTQASFRARLPTARGSGSRRDEHRHRRRDVCLGGSRLRNCWPWRSRRGGRVSMCWCFSKMSSNGAAVGPHQRATVARGTTGHWNDSTASSNVKCGETAHSSKRGSACSNTGRDAPGTDFPRVPLTRPDRG